MKNVEDLYPLTPTQSGMLFQILRDEDPALYFEQVRVDLAASGQTVEVADIRAAFEAVTRRHPALRTAIVWDGLEQPLQAVRTTVEVPFEVRHHPGISDEGLELLASQRRQSGFDLTAAPLQRVAVVDCGGGRLHLIWEFHHIVCDGWSAAIVLDEVLTHLNHGSVPTKARPFREYLAWHRSQDNEGTAVYWKQLLDGFGDPTSLQLPRASTSERFSPGEVIEWIDGPQLAALSDFARSHRLTLNTLVQGAWSIMQALYSGNDDVVFGVTTSGRPADLPNVAGIVGMFLNTLPMRATVDPSAAIDTWLAQVQAQQLESAEHVTASLAELHRHVGIGVGDELFDTVLIFENFPKPEVDPAAAIAFENKTVFEQTNYPLTLMVGVEDSRLKLVAHYDRSRFAEEAMNRLIAQLVMVLSRMLTAETVGAIDVLTDADRREIEAVQGAPIDLAVDETVTGRLIRQATATPDAVALLHGDHATTFGELLDRAKGVAARLERLGAGPEVPVGIAIPRSVEMVVAMVGVLLAGSAYVPLDPRFPAARLKLMLEVSEAPIVLTEPASATAVPAVDGVEVVDVTTVGSLPGGPPPIAATNPGSTLLLTFTSGSTGVPKGVRVHHAGVLNRCEWQWATYPIIEGEVLPHKTTLGFVDHLWEIWGGLLNGSTVLLIDDETVGNVDGFIDELARHRVRRVSMVPSLLDLMMDHAPDLADRLPELSMWSVSGEALSVATANRFGQCMSGATLINLYGMSEASQDVTFAEIAPGAPHVPIGRPIANMAVHLLDHHDRAVPIGVPGQIHVAGVGLSPGYWQRPDLTDERFVPAPVTAADGDADDPPARMYRTGDIARWTSDGNLEYLGRTDHQVKVRGVRIELGEVETAIASHPDVDRAVVVGLPGPGGTELVAYTIPRRDRSAGESPDPGQRLMDRLRNHCRERLPEVMVPTHFVDLPDFPLLPNGKVNRNALPLPQMSVSPKTEPPAPLNRDQQAMLALWRSVMDQPALGPDEDFFDVGGHSMLAMRLVSRIKTDLGLTVGLAQLLRTGTARSLADSLRAATGRPRSAVGLRHAVPILRPDASLPTLFVVHGAGGDILNFRAMAQRLIGVVNLIGVQAAGVDGVSELHPDRSVMVDDYLADIRAVQATGPYLLAGFSIGGIIAFELAERLAAAGDRVDQIILFDTFHPSVEPRLIPATEHLRKLVTDSSYGMFKLRSKIDAAKANRARRKALEDPAGGPIPFEVRKAQITDNTIGVWLGYRPAVTDVPVVLMSSVSNADIWDGIADDRGWSGTATDLTVVKTPGDHITLVEPPNAAVMIERLLPHLRMAHEGANA